MVTITAAITTPNATAKKAGIKRMRKIEAIIAPVHAPVPGKGTATKSIRPIASYRSTISACCLALLNSHSKNLRINLVLLNFLDIVSNKKYMGAMGRILPNTENKNVSLTPCFNINMPMGMEALNSVTGRLAKNKIIVFGEKPNPENN